MIIEELAARFSISVDGLNKLRGALKQFAGFRKEVSATVNPLKVSAASTALVAAGVGKVGSEAKKSSRSVLLMGTAFATLKKAGTAAASILRTIFTIALRIIGVMAGLAAGVAAAGAAFVAIGVKAATARREMRLMAATIGTSAQNLETATNAFSYFGLGDGAKDAAKKAVGAIDEILKAIKAGGDEAVEAKKKLSGFGIDGSLGIGKDGKMRDSVAVLFDAIQAYKKLTDEAAAFRKQADGVDPKNVKKADALRSKALAKERLAGKLAEGTGVDDRLKVLLDEKTLAQVMDLVNRSGRERPTTSSAQENLRKEVSDQAIDIGLKAEAVIDGLTGRLTDFSVVVASQVLPAVNSFFDSLLGFAKKVGIIPENVGEKGAREAKERVDARAAGMRAERTTNEITPQQRRNLTQRELVEKQDKEFRKRYGSPTEAPLPPERPGSMDPWKNVIRRSRQSENLEDRRRVALPARDKDTSLAANGLLQQFMSIIESIPSILQQISPETNASKMQKAAENKTENDNRTYSDIGTDKRTISVTNNLSVADPSGVAAAAARGVLGAISTKGANTSTGALTAP